MSDAGRPGRAASDPRGEATAGGNAGCRPRDLARYERQLIFAPLGREGQTRLLEARVGLVGCGALGSTIATHLVRSGVGYLRLVDRDYPQLHNLHRQLLYTEQDVARRVPKAVAAAEHLRAANSEVEIEPVVDDINPFSVERFVQGLDLLVDGTDNFPTRFLMNDVAVRDGLPWVYGGVIGASGMTMTIVPGEGPCLRCLFPEPPPPGSMPTCDTAGVLSPAVAVVASIQAAEAIKLLVEPEARNRDLLSLDLWEVSFERLQVQRNPECECCVKGNLAYLAAEQEYDVASVCGRNAMQVSPRTRSRLDLGQLEDRLALLGPTRRNEYLVEAEVEGLLLTVFADGRALIAGLDDPTMALAAYSRLVGH
jgi:molybdopterin-synthase adenylyltransferase